MPTKTVKDHWIEISIREILMQAQFATIAYSNINVKAAKNNIAVFSSIHSFLSHCAMVSKMLRAAYDNTSPKSIGDVLGIPNTAVIHERDLRNHLEHYDERLAEWIKRYGVNRMIGIDNIGPKRAIRVLNMLFVRHYDPETDLFTFVNDDFDLGAFSREIQRIETIANNWLRDEVSGRPASFSE